MESSNSYQRAIQYQQLEKEQFQAEHPPGFFHSVGCPHNSHNAAYSLCCDVCAWRAGPVKGG